MPDMSTELADASVAAPAAARRVPWQRRVHRMSAIVLVAYALPHLLNHLLALGGIERHLAFMRLLRVVVREPAVEALLLACVACQALSGIALLLRRRRWNAQAVSGAYLGFFLALHLGAVLNARLRLGLDTNFYFAAAGLNVAPYPLFFAPYYAAAIVALGVHLACALRLRGRAATAAIAGSALLAATIVATFAGALYPVSIPPAYRAALRLDAPTKKPAEAGFTERALLSGLVGDAGEAQNR